MIAQPGVRNGIPIDFKELTRDERKAVRALPEGTVHVGIVCKAVWVNAPEDVGEKRHARRPDGWKHGVLDSGTSIGQTLEGDYVVLHCRDYPFGSGTEHALPAGSRFVIRPGTFEDVTSDQAYEQMDRIVQLYLSLSASGREAQRRKAQGLGSGGLRLSSGQIVGMITAALLGFLLVLLLLGLTG